MRYNPQSGLSNPTRRTFLLTTGSTAAATVVAACVPVFADRAIGQGEQTGTTVEPTIAGAVPITLRINGKEHKLRIDPRTTLLDCIRETVALAGTKKVCDH